MIKPINGQILVEQVKKEHKGGLIVSTEEYERYHLVLEMSDDIPNPQVKVGDHVTLSIQPYFKMKEKQYIVSYKDVIAVIEHQ